MHLQTMNMANTVYVDTMDSLASTEKKMADRSHDIDKIIFRTDMEMHFKSYQMANVSQIGVASPQKNITKSIIYNNTKDANVPELPFDKFIANSYLISTMKANQNTIPHPNQQKLAKPSQPAWNSTHNRQKFEKTIRLAPATILTYKTAISNGKEGAFPMHVAQIKMFMNCGNARQIRLLPHRYKKTIQIYSDSPHITKPLMVITKLVNRLLIQDGLASKARGSPKITRRGGKRVDGPEIEPCMASPNEFANDPVDSAAETHGSLHAKFSNLPGDTSGAKATFSTIDHFETDDEKPRKESKEHNDVLLKESAKVSTHEIQKTLSLEDVDEGRSSKSASASPVIGKEHLENEENMLGSFVPISDKSAVSILVQEEDFLNNSNDHDIPNIELIDTDLNSDEISNV